MRSGVIIESLTARPLRVPLLLPFVIATARVDETRAALIEVRVSDRAGGQARGLGEAAALWPVTREDLPDILSAVEGVRGSLEGRTLQDLRPGLLDELLGGALSSSPVARAGIESALLDGIARLRRAPAHALLGAGVVTSLVTDITIPIGDADQMALLARAHQDRGFDCFKVKVGKDRDSDLRALLAIAAAVPGARFRLDANAGFGPDDALSLVREVERRGVLVECFEQPCAEDDLDAMAFVAERSRPPVVADESVKTMEDLERVIARKAARGVNLKLSKSGGPIEAFAIGQRARAAGLSLMCGAMVETRLGLSAMAHVASALGGVEWVDLDTAFLLAEDPFVGGYVAEGATLKLVPGAGFGVSNAAG